MFFDQFAPRLGPEASPTQDGPCYPCAALSRKKRRRQRAAKRKNEAGAATAATRKNAAADEASDTLSGDASTPTPTRDAATTVAEKSDSHTTSAADSTPLAPTEVETLSMHRVGPHGLGAVPRSMKLALFATAAAALLSTSVALYVVLRDDDSERTGLVRTAEAAVRADDTRVPPSSGPATVAAAGSSAAVLATKTAAKPQPSPAPESPWPDLEVDTLPAVGSAPAHMGQSIGSPRDGALLAPHRMPNGRNYILRDEDTAWGTDNTVAQLRKAIGKLRRKHPTMQRVVIGDISTQRGGPLSGHTSHQSGRDVDLGLVHRGRTEETATAFIEGTHENLDRRITYDLIAALAATRDEPGGVELIVLDYGLQRILRRSATARGVPEEELEALFQYPHGPESRHGLVRHMPAHRDHVHVRFSCPPDDRFCRSPLLGFAGMDNQ